MEWNLTNMFPGLKPPTRKPVDVGLDVWFLVEFFFLFCTCLVVWSFWLLSKVEENRNMWTCLKDVCTVFLLKNIRYQVDIKFRGICSKKLPLSWLISSHHHLVHFRRQKKQLKLGKLDAATIFVKARCLFLWIL